MPVRLDVAQSASMLANDAAARFFAVAKEAIERDGVCHVALAGGETPRAAYEAIATRWAEGNSGIVWNRIHVFWSDERMVPHDDSRSNYRMARAALLSKVPIPADNVHAVPTSDGDAKRAAEKYEATIREIVPVDAKGMPRFDLILLGLGEDGHTASLFPSSPALEDSTSLVAVTQAPGTDEARVTFTLPVLNNAATLVVLVSGPTKAGILERVVRGVGRAPRSPFLPAESLRPTMGHLIWMADEQAAPWTRSADPDPTP